MPDCFKTLIMKFGGSAVETPQKIAAIADLILKRSEEYPKILIVVSAMKGMTDNLIHLASQIHPCPPRREYDMLVSSGERISSALLAMALELKGKKGVSFTGSQSGIITCGSHTEAKIIDVRPMRLVEALNRGDIAIVAGFQGMSLDKEITTLGRGGSDTTAVALGVALAADRVEFYKDVQGIYNKDPNLDHSATAYETLNYQDAYRLVTETGGKVLHPRAVKLAEKNSLPLFVRSFIFPDVQGTWILDEKKTVRESNIYE